MYEIGVTRSFDNGYYLSVGYFFSPASTSTQYFTPLVPDTDLHVGSVGGGYKGKHWDWAAAFQLIAGGWRSVTAEPPTASLTVSTGSLRRRSRSPWDTTSERRNLPRAPGGYSARSVAGSGSCVFARSREIHGRVTGHTWEP